MVNGYHRIFLAYDLSYSHFQKTLYTSLGAFFPKTAVVIDDLTNVVSLNLFLHSFVAAAAATSVDNIDSGPFFFIFVLFVCLFVLLLFNRF